MTQVERDKNLALANATQQQRNAADPAFTRMASANAGSGKTRVLVDRVSRILLQGTEPSDILCLTYTKAAAAEMQERLFKKLGDWAVASEAKLAGELQELFGQALADLPVPIDLALARQLFAKALETPEGLKVQTIHAFCERILSRFPIEAGILPGFAPLDDMQSASLRRSVRRQILIEAQVQPDGELARAIGVLGLAKADQSLEDLFSWMAGSGEKIRLWEAAGGLAPLCDLMGIELGSRPQDFAAQAWHDMNANLREKLLAALSASSKITDNKNADKLRQAIEVEKDAAVAFQTYSPIFFKSNGDFQPKVGTKELGEEVLNLLIQEGQRVLHATEKMQCASVLNLTAAVYTIALRYRVLYKQAKHAARGLDYNDQILLVRDLLSNTDVADWVRYKLDGGIEHILVDEAQDTSPQQWEIIDALAAPFFQPSPDEGRKNPRTLFAVGDEKQSIFRFQGAVPEMFLKKIREYMPISGMGEVRMRMSFRSAQQVLDVVDHVLNAGGAMRDMFDADSYPPSSDIITHPAWRQDNGCAELWPIVPRPQTLEDNEPWDTRPVDAMGESNQREILAKHIARTIRGWIDEGKSIFDTSKGDYRPIHAGDVLILVRSRGVFFEAVIRQLKKHDIAVAGADRLTLQDSVVVKDMLALTRFVLLPADDLSLAEVLKSPFFGFDDERLMAACIGREGRLWEALKSHAPKTAKILTDLIALSKTPMPYDFYAQFLERKTEDGRTFRQAIYERLSLEAQDALEAFLACAMEHHIGAVPSLQRFLLGFENHDVQIKREMDGAAKDVRVMTVHGAKGLEAPIVILPDTTQVPKSSKPLVSVQSEFAWRPSKDKMPDALQDFIKAEDDKVMQEQIRLLYVAMTRAESRLIICGYDNGQNKTGVKDGSWYDRLASSFDTLETDDFEISINGETLTGQRYGTLPNPLAKMPKAEIPKEDAPKADIILPAWISSSAPEEARAPNYVTPSHLLASPAVEPAAASPRGAPNKSQFLRGNIIHKLLEVLPEFEIERRRDIAATILKGYPNLEDGQAAEILAEVFTVLEHDDFSQIFAPGSRAEISLAGSAKTLPPNMYLNAQIDRLCITPERVFIVDYKSNRPAPTKTEDIAPIYLGQMAAYRELAREIYPAREIICALLWTNGPHLTVLPDKLMDLSLQNLSGLPKSGM